MVGGTTTVRSTEMQDTRRSPHTARPLKSRVVLDQFDFALMFVVSVMPGVGDFAEFD
jgi:hypothetical protein